MPIRPENKARYPKDWPAISRRIREAAGNECQKCKAPNGEWIRRGVTDDCLHVYRLESQSAFENGFCASSGVEIRDTCEDEVGYGRFVRVVLTVAHLDHTPENCADENLRAWCQRCHNAYDAPMRRAGIKRRAKQAAAKGDLFPMTLLADDERAAP